MDINKSRFEDISTKLKSDPTYLFIINACPGVIGIFDYDKLNYDFVSNNISKIFGIHSSELMKGGLEYFFNVLCTSHAEIVVNQIYPIFLQYCDAYGKKGELHKLKFSYEYKINCNKPNGGLWCLHNLTIIETTPSGMPSKDIFHITDINDTKKDENINFIIFELDDDNVYKQIHKKNYATIKQDLLSERELEIARLIINGNTASEIATLLFLSEHTVKTHRKNIMAKLKVNKTTDLINTLIENKMV